MIAVHGPQNETFDVEEGLVPFRILTTADFMREVVLHVATRFLLTL